MKVDFNGTNWPMKKVYMPFALGINVSKIGFIPKNWYDVFAHRRHIDVSSNVALCAHCIHTYTQCYGAHIGMTFSMKRKIKYLLVERGRENENNTLVFSLSYVIALPNYLYNLLVDWYSGVCIHISKFFWTNLNIQWDGKVFFSLPLLLPLLLPILHRHLQLFLIE